jgi:hypothetical protein
MLGIVAWSPPRPQSTHYKPGIPEKEFIKRSVGTRIGDGPYIRHYDLTPLVGILKEASRNALAERVRRAQQVQQV